jgi:pyruvate/2-oxoglutarate/acetoin dehydrogenase E1 component/TPP-dependent pyruvate/acetoin dehydrogenase alpha subunit
MIENEVLLMPLKNVPREDIIQDFRTCCISREASIVARREVLSGKAKFGITGDGKEVPQVAMARAFKEGDIRSGYYRDQTFMFATGLSTVEEFFAQLYADSDNDPFSGGRQMNSHYATPFIDKNNEWLPLTELKNVSADISTTAGQMSRAVGLGLASKLYRQNSKLKDERFSKNGNEVTFVTIGDASTSEGVFWESMNAAGVMQIPMAVSVWDDGYGISVPTKYQTTKGSISEALKGFESDEQGEGFDIYIVKAWNYAELLKVYEYAIDNIRETHKPCLIHVKEVTQPQGHSTSGSHERYKSKERLAWEKEWDCIDQMEKWMVTKGICTIEETTTIRKEAKKAVKDAKTRAWKAYINPVKAEIKKVNDIYDRIIAVTQFSVEISDIKNKLKNAYNPLLADVIESVKSALRILKSERTNPQIELENWLKSKNELGHQRYHTHLYLEGQYSALDVPEVSAIYSDDSPLKNGYEILNTFFDKSFEQNPYLVAFGEDVGQIGDVNQGFAGLQNKFGEERIFDTGIREWTIMGQGIGLAMRGFRPIAEIQYLDYLMYGLTPLTDDLATLQYRSKGQQIAPMIIRTRGHRLEGIWHTGSPMGVLLHSLRGVYILTPRNMVQAAGMYNTMLQSKEPAVLVECLNGYRLKEKMPDNLLDFTVPLGVPEILNVGTDVTLVSYGSTIREAEKAVKLLAKDGISVELIDAQTLLPFDRYGIIGASLKKTNRIVFMDEDVPGGATAYMMQEVLEKQKGYFHLDSEPRTLTASAHRGPYGSDGDYFSKPNADSAYEMIYELMHEVQPNRFPKQYFMR